MARPTSCAAVIFNTRTVPSSVLIENLGRIVFKSKNSVWNALPIFIQRAGGRVKPLIAFFAPGRHESRVKQLFT